MKKNAKKITIITVILVILILLLIQIIQLIPKNKQSETQEVIQTSNNEKEEVLAETSVVLNAEQKKQFMEELSVGWDDSKVEKVNVKLDSKSETEEIPIPVPKGYKISGVEGENTLDGGVVIYEGTDEVSGESDSEGVKTAQKTRNQWVWVPVYDPNEIYGVDANGKMWGKLYNYSTSGGTKDNWSETDGVIRISSSSNDREPDVVTGYDKDDYLPNYLSQEDRADLDNELTTNFENSIKSIKKYGGFYIGRYETGGLNETAKVVKGDTNISSQTWYTMYKKCKTLNGTNDNVVTSMIYGSEWDRTLQWLVDTGTKSYEEIGTDSTSWGNYKNNSFQYDENTSGRKSNKNSGSSTRIPSGSAEVTKANNIYDLAGNVWDWTLEAYSTYSRRYRGGSYYGTGSDYPAGYRYGNGPGNSGGSLGCRAALYVDL